MDDSLAYLVDELREENRFVTLHRELFNRDIVAQAKKELCCQCREECYATDTARLPCGHVHCFDCLGDRLERTRGYCRRRHPELLPRAPVLKSIVVCCQCHCPAVLAERISYGNLAWHSNRRAYEVNRKATALLKTRVRSYYQNQRRSLLGRFLFSSLLPFERGPFTEADINGTKALFLENIESIEGRRNAQGECEYYLEDWTYNSAEGDALGWLYSFNWPSPKRQGSWQRKASALTFVRRRKMLRASIIVRVET